MSHTSLREILTAHSELEAAVFARKKEQTKKTWYSVHIIHIYKTLRHKEGGASLKNKLRCAPPPPHTCTHSHYKYAIVRHNQLRIVRNTTQFVHNLLIHSYIWPKEIVRIHYPPRRIAGKKQTHHISTYYTRIFPKHRVQ